MKVLFSICVLFLFFGSSVNASTQNIPACKVEDEKTMTFYVLEKDSIVSRHVKKSNGELKEIRYELIGKENHAIGTGYNVFGKAHRKGRVSHMTMSVGSNIVLQVFFAGYNDYGNLVSAWSIKCFK